jgi:hypothetical protein
MPAKKKAESPEAEAQQQDAEVQTTTAPENPSGDAFESFIKGGPTQDDLNPAYAPQKEEGDGDDDGDDEGGDGEATPSAAPSATPSTSGSDK